MEFCTRCGHELGVGRFCTNCGHPVESRNPPDEWREDTAERPVIAPHPSGPPPPPVPRYPLFADEVAAAQPVTPPPPPPPPGPPTPPTPHRRSRRPWLVLLIWVGLALVLVLGAVLLLGDDDPGEDRATDSGPRDTSTTAADPTTAPTAASTTPPTTTAPGEPTDVAAVATVSVPATAPPNQDVAGNQVRYEGRNMLDGVPETCWRMPGDGTGSELTISLAEPTTISRVGLINGYAKTAGGLDWYQGNRRILAVEWVFDDGSVVDQDLAETRDLQSLDVEPVTTSTILLRILEVSKPGRGPAARNYTPISDVELVGVPG